MVKRLLESPEEGCTEGRLLLGVGVHSDSEHLLDFLDVSGEPFQWPAIRLDCLTTAELSGELVPGQFGFLARHGWVIFC